MFSKLTDVQPSYDTVLVYSKYFWLGGYLLIRLVGAYPNIGAKLNCRRFLPSSQTSEKSGKYSQGKRLV
jgi:hypothetical protein